MRKSEIRSRDSTMGGEGEASREIVRRLNRFDSRPDRFCNEHPRDRLISGCGFYSLSANRAPRFLDQFSSTEFEHVLLWFVYIYNLLHEWRDLSRDELTANACTNIFDYFSKWTINEVKIRSKIGFQRDIVINIVIVDGQWDRSLSNGRILC